MLKSRKHLKIITFAVVLEGPGTLANNWSGMPVFCSQRDTFFHRHGEREIFGLAEDIPLWFKARKHDLWRLNYVSLSTKKKMVPKNLAREGESTLDRAPN